MIAAHDAALKGWPGHCELMLNGRTLELQVQPDGEGGAIAVALDVTERRRQEAERVQARLQRAQKLELLGILAGGIAHDFNNLLTSIQGFISLGRLELPPGSPVEALLARAEASAERAADLTHQMLAYSGRGRFTIQRVDLSELVREMTRLLQVSISKDARLTFELADEPLFITGDLSQLRQVLMNLITNASDALPDGSGRITVATSPLVADRAFLDTTYLEDDVPEGEYVSFSVSDTGQGMSPDVVQSMFDPFFTTKTTGHGLGLAATLGVVRSHKGTVRVETEVGQGTTVTVLLPFAEQDAPVETVATPAPTETRGGEGHTVLVVDDESAVRALANAVLSARGYQVTLASDGLEAVEILESDPGRIELVVLDLTMPRMNGEATLEFIRAHHPALPVLLSSGFSESEVAGRFERAANIRFLQKPYRASQLLTAVESLLQAQESM